MPPIVPYHDLVLATENAFPLRVQMVQYALEHGISAAAKAYGATRVTVRKWVYRYEEHGTEGLKDRSRAPHRIPHKTPKSVEEKALRLRKRLPGFGPDRLAREFDLPCSGGALRRIFREHALVKKRRRRKQKQRDLRERKARLKPFEHIQIDTKDLSDIAEVQEALSAGHLPRYQYTARDVRTGALFLAYARENTLFNATLFGTYVLQHLKAHEALPEGAVVQTDNGSEFVGSWNAKRKSAFAQLVEEIGPTHRRIPPGAKTWQSDVETSHRIIEPEFYCIERFDSHAEVLGKAFTYQLYFNHQRANSYKGYRSPVQLLKELAPEIAPEALSLPPLVMDTLYQHLISQPRRLKLQPGYDVPSRVISCRASACSFGRK
jgi:transposase